MRTDARQVDVRRRVDNLLRLGVVAAVDLDRARVRVRYAGSDDAPALTGWVPWMTPRAGDARTWWAPSVGEQVVLASPSGELAAAVVLGSLFQIEHPPPSNEAHVRRTVYADGAVVEYDAEAHALRATLPAGGTVVITGDLEASGDLEDAGGTLAALRATYNTHTHPGIGSPPTQRA